MSEKMIKPDPIQAAASFERAKSEFLANRDSEAEEYLWQTLQADSSHHDAWQLLGVIARRNNHPAALPFFMRALELGGTADDFVNVGESLQNMKRMAEAEECHNAAIAIDNRNAAAWANRAVIEERRCDYARAEQSIDTATECNPKWHLPRVNKIQLLLQAGEYDRALKQAEHCIEVCPELPQAHWNYALCLIQHGQWDKGWKEYEYRWQLPGFVSMNPMPTHVPLWDGQDPKGKTILIVCEQGAGDAIQFIRYARALHEAGATVCVLAAPKLVPLLACVPGVYEAASTVESMTPADCFVPIMSLPCIFGTTPDNACAGDRYINPPVSEKWADRIGALPECKVGIAYAGNPNHANDRDRSTKAEDLQGLADVGGVSFVSLQFDRQEEWPIRAIDYSADVFSFLDTAQMIDQLDVVITVCTSVAHLAGALGKKTLLLVSHSSDARWMLNRDDTPWYPSVEIRRKPIGKTWREFVASAAKDWLILEVCHALPVAK